MGKQGYVTFVKENKKDDIFLKNYTLNKDLKEGSEVACDFNMMIYDDIPESLRHMDMEEWNNLMFLYVEEIKEHYMNGVDGNRMPLSKDIKVLEVLDHDTIFNKLLNSISLYGDQTFAKYVKGIKLGIEERAKVLDTIVEKIKIGNGLFLATFAYYQYQDKDAYYKLRDNKEIIPIIKK